MLVLATSSTLAILVQLVYLVAVKPKQACSYSY